MTSTQLFGQYLITIAKLLKNYSSHINFTKSIYYPVELKIMAIMDCELIF
jgi:hypothetical protein